MNTSLAAVPTPPLEAAVIESVLLQGDLSRLTPAQRLAYYNRVCESLGLNPLTKPFEYLMLSGKLVLYARRDATEQLRKIHGVSIVEISSRELGGVFIVTAKAQDARQRIDVSTGAVAIATLKGEALANALMKAETKAKRRVTLSICGLGMLDETEVETIPQAAVQAVATAEPVNLATGELVAEAPAPKTAAKKKATKAAPPEAATPTGPGLFVKRIERDDAAGTWQITLSDGHTRTTKAKVIQARAQSCLQYGQPIEVELLEDGEIKDLRRAGPASDDAHPI